MLIQRFHRIWFFRLILMSIFLVSPCFADIASPTLDGLIEESTYIVIGKVRKITVYRGIKVAELEVNYTLKGSPRVRKLSYLAENGGGCDITKAEIDEPVLLFLTKANSVAEAPAWLKEKLDLIFSLKYDPRGWSEKFQELISGIPFLKIAWSGHGRMPLKRLGTADPMALMPGVDLPKPLRIIPEADPECSTYICVPLFDLLALVRERIGTKGW